jgi:hypothetical protein
MYSQKSNSQAPILNITINLESELYCSVSNKREVQYSTKGTAYFQKELRNYSSNLMEEIYISKLDIIYLVFEIEV